VLPGDRGECIVTDPSAGLGVLETTRPQLEIHAFLSDVNTFLLTRFKSTHPESNDLATFSSGRVSSIQPLAASSKGAQ
jgi:hypothetical protein